MGALLVVELFCVPGGAWVFVCVFALGWKSERQKKERKKGRRIRGAVRRQARRRNTNTVRRRKREKKKKKKMRAVNSSRLASAEHLVAIIE